MSREHTPDPDKTPVSGPSDTTYKRSTPQSGVIDSKPNSAAGKSHNTPGDRRSLEIVHVEHPKVVGRWKVLGSLGEGGMGAVFRAQHEVMDKVAAVKFLHPQLMSSGQALVRFQREAKAANQLNHPNVVSVFDCGVTDDGWAFQVMEYIEGKSLAEVLKEETRLPLTRALKIFVQICDALGHAHSKNVIHRDLKPSNVMLLSDKTKPDTVKIVDFGIAKVLNTDNTSDSSQMAGLTAKGQVFGSPHYMSPEQCMALEIDARSDVYAMGCLMYETLSGSPPFAGKSYLETMAAQMNQDTPPLVSPQIPEKERLKIEPIIRKALDKNRETRYQSMEELKTSLEAILAQLDASFRKQGNGSSRKLMVFGTIAISIAIAMSTVATILVINNNPKPPPQEESALPTLDATKDRIVWFIWPRPYAKPGTPTAQYGVELERTQKGRDLAVTQIKLAISGGTEDISADTIARFYSSLATLHRDAGHYNEAVDSCASGYDLCKSLFRKLEKLSESQLNSDKRLANLLSEKAYCHYMIANSKRPTPTSAVTGHGLVELQSAKELYDQSIPILTRFPGPLQQDNIQRDLMVAAEVNLELGCLASKDLTQQKHYLEDADKYLSIFVERTLTNGKNAPRSRFIKEWTHATCLRGDLQKLFKTKYSVYAAQLTDEERSRLTATEIYSAVEAQLNAQRREKNPQPELELRALWLSGLNCEHERKYKSAKQYVVSAVKLLNQTAQEMKQDEASTLTALISRDLVRIIKELPEASDEIKAQNRSQLIAQYTQKCIAAAKFYNIESLWWRQNSTPGVQ